LQNIIRHITASIFDTTSFLATEVHFNRPGCMAVRHFGLLVKHTQQRRKNIYIWNDKLLQAHSHKFIMKKPTLTCIILSAAILMLFFAACKKNSVKPVVSTMPDYAAMSSQAAVTLYRSITGQYGGIDVSRGISSPFNTNNAAPRPQSVNTANLLCGYIIDTAYNYTTHSGANGDPADTIFHHTGSFKFVYTCDGGKVDGYQVTDSTFYQQYNQAIDILNDFSVAQNYTVKAVDQTYKIVSMNGSLNSSVSLTKFLVEILSQQDASYHLNGLIVNFTSGTADVTSGTATFHMAVGGVHVYDSLDPYILTYYDGTIQFLRNHTARLTINPNHVYLVNLITGVVTPA
jgi:hypothetical protein